MLAQQRYQKFERRSTASRFLVHTRRLVWNHSLFSVHWDRFHPNVVSSRSTDHAKKDNHEGKA